MERINGDVTRGWKTAWAISIAWHSTLVAFLLCFNHGLNANVIPKKAGVASIAVSLTLVKPHPPNLIQPRHIVKDTFSKKRGTIGGSKTGGSLAKNAKREYVNINSNNTLTSQNNDSTPDTNVTSTAPVIDKVVISQPESVITSPVSNIEVASVPVSNDSAYSNSNNTGEEISDKVAGGNGAIGGGMDGTGEGSGTGKGHGQGSGTGTGDGIGKGSGIGDGVGIGYYAYGGNGLPYGLTGNGDKSPRRTVYVIDMSPSMARKIKSSVREVLSVTKDLVTGDQFNFILFAEKSKIMSRTLVDVNDDTLDQAKRFLSQAVETDGGTNIEQALRKAVMIPETKEIVLITDGVPTQGETSASSLASKIRRVNVNHIQIYTIGLMDRMRDSSDDIDEAKILLGALALQNSGASRILDAE